MKSIRNAVLVGVLALGLASNGWAVNRSDLVTSDGETFTNATVDSDGNFVFDNAYSAYMYNYYHYGYIYRTVTTPGGATSVQATFELLEPDLVLMGSTKSKMKSSDGLYVEGVTLYEPGTTTTNTFDADAVEGCKGKIILTGTASDSEGSASFAKTMVNCNEAALQSLFPTSSERAKVQSLLGTRPDGTGIKWKGLDLADTDL